MFKKGSSHPPSANVPSMISEITEIIGDIKSQGQIRYDGILKGNIMADNVRLGVNAQIHGTIIANELTVFGTVNGEIHVKFVSLMKTSNVTGVICKDTISIETGAKYSGQTMDLDHTKLNAIPKQEDIRMISYQGEQEDELNRTVANNNDDDDDDK